MFKISKFSRRSIHRTVLYLLTACAVVLSGSFGLISPAMAAPSQQSGQTDTSQNLLFLPMVTTAFTVDSPPTPDGNGNIPFAANGSEEVADDLLALPPQNYTTHTNLLQVPNVTGAQIDNAVRSIRSDSGLIGLGDVIVETGKRHNINPIYIVSHAALESAWGTSRIAREKNNLFGYAAFDHCPYDCAQGYASKADSVKFVMEKVKQNYLTPGGAYYNGAHLAGMNVRYATDKQWANSITSIMNNIASRIGSHAYPGGSPSTGGGCYGGAVAKNQTISAYSYKYIGEFRTSSRCKDINVKFNHTGYVYVRYLNSNGSWQSKGWQRVSGNRWFAPTTGIRDNVRFQLFIYNPNSSSRYYQANIAY